MRRGCGARVRVRDGGRYWLGRGNHALDARCAIRSRSSVGARLRRRHRARSAHRCRRRACDRPHRRARPQALQRPHQRDARRSSSSATASTTAPACAQINRFLRDWRKEQPTNMDPQLLDLLWQVYRQSGSQRLHPRRLRLPLARHQRHAAPPLARASPRTACTCRARRSTSSSPACRLPSSAPSACRCRPAASASTRRPARRSCTWTPAASATGRA